MSMFLGWYVMTRACRSAAVRLLPGVVTNPLSVLLPHEVVLFLSGREGTHVPEKAAKCGLIVVYSASILSST